jgi:hypothetical protein
MRGKGPSNHAGGRAGTQEAAKGVSNWQQEEVPPSGMPPAAIAV